MSSITRRSHGTRAVHRDQIVARLLAAVEHFLESGESYTEVSVERLVVQAGISRSTFYVYFENKGDLLRALTADVMTDIMGAAARWWELPPGSAREEVGDALLSLIDAYRPHQLLMAAVVDVSSYDVTVREAYTHLVEQAVAGVAEHIEAGQEQGSVRPEIDAQPTAAWLTWMAERGLQQLVRPSSDAQLHRLGDALTTIVWNSLYEGTPTRDALPRD